MKRPLTALAVALVLLFVANFGAAQAPAPGNSVAGLPFGLGSLTLGAGNTGTQTLSVYDATPTTGVTTADFRLGAGQSTTKLTTWSSGATTYFGVDASLNVGLYQGNHFFAYNSGGTNRLSAFNNTGVSLVTGNMFTWTNSATDAGGTKDTGLARSAAGVVEINNGTTNTGGGLKIPGLKSTTGTRYVCIDSTGVISSSASACSGT